LNPDIYTRKLGTYKVFGLTDKTSPDHYWFLGVSKQYLCKVKAYIIWGVKNNKQSETLSEKIKSLNYKFQIEEIERMPLFDFEKAKLHLQKHYLDKYQVECNTNNFCFCSHLKPDAEIHPPIAKDIKEKIISMAIQGKRAVAISRETGVKPTTINSILKRNGLSMKERKSQAIESLRCGMPELEVKQKYFLSDRALKLVKNKLR